MSVYIHKFSSVEITRTRTFPPKSHMPTKISECVLIKLYEHAKLTNYS